MGSVLMGSVQNFEFVFMGLWGPGPFPMDPDRNSVHNGGMYIPGARIWTPLVAKSVKRQISEPQRCPKVWSPGGRFLAGTFFHQKTNSVPTPLVPTPLVLLGQMDPMGSHGPNGPNRPNRTK